MSKSLGNSEPSFTGGGADGVHGILSSTLTLKGSMNLE
jgi:hypothetical protein